MIWDSKSHYLVSFKAAPSVGAANRRMLDHYNVLDHGLGQPDRGLGDPFADLRIDADESERAPFELDELRLIFNSPVFSESARPAPTCARPE